MSGTILQAMLRGVRGLLALALVGAVACDDAIAPDRQSREPIPAALIDNAVKYRDAGHKPMTGRSGGMSLTVAALLGKDGMTDIYVDAFDVDGAATADLQKVQRKLFSLDDRLLSTTNDNHLDDGSVTYRLAGLVRNQPIQVQANVGSAHSPRTGVITVRELVKLRPDLAVGAVQGPDEGWVFTPMAFEAIVRELNGDVGARADCVLEVDGVPVDSTLGIWVDAGGAVSCAFTYTFPAIGTHVVTVRAINVVPGDWDMANNSASKSVIVRTEVPLQFDASATSDSSVSWSTYRRDFTTGGGFHEGATDSSGSAGVMQRSSFDGWSREPSEFPEQPLTDVSLAQSTGGHTVHALHFDALAADAPYVSPDSSYGCVARAYATDVVASFMICSMRRVQAGTPSWYTSIAYRWNAGDVTYYSIGWSERMCLPGSGPCTPYSYTWNTRTPTVTGSVVPFGSDFRFDVGFTSGYRRFVAAPVIPLATSTQTLGQPVACSSTFGYYPPADRVGFSTWCQGSSDVHVVTTGTVEQH